MAPIKPGAGGSVTHIGNKMKRQDVYRKLKKDKATEKLQKRIKQAADEKADGGAERKKARLEANKPRTIENTRVHNPTIISAPNTHEGPGPSQAYLDQQRASSSSARVSDGDVDGSSAEKIVEDEEDLHAPPALLITTALPHNSMSSHLVSANSRSHPAERVRDFVQELLNVFPGAEYRERSKAKGAGLGKICGWARTRGYDAVLVIGEDKKEPVSLTIVSLPIGPTAFFRLTSLSLGKEIYGHARPTGHTPELIMNNFTTTLGHDVGRLLQGMFPKMPDLAGRQVITAHNQRDFIFFRRHRYAFRNGERADLQEIGPRFTLKLRSLKQALPKGAGVWDGEIAFDGKKVAAEEAAAERAAAGEIDHDGDDDASDDAGRGDAPHANVTRKRSREDEEYNGLDFEWKPKMGVSRRNFYL